jgi:hypothetical protein
LPPDLGGEPEMGTPVRVGRSMPSRSGAITVAVVFSYTSCA